MTGALKNRTVLVVGRGGGLAHAVVGTMGVAITNATADTLSRSLALERRGSTVGAR